MTKKQIACDVQSYVCGGKAPLVVRKFGLRRDIRDAGGRTRSPWPAAVLVLIGVLACARATSPSPARGAEKVDPAATQPATQEGMAAGHAAAVSADPQKLAEAEGQILKVFGARCANCHQEGAKKVKKFGYVLDLGRMAANPKYVHPAQPADKSKLYSTIDDDSMPPDDDPKGPLEPGQKKSVLAALKTWIEAGAPAPPASVTLAAVQSGQPGQPGPTTAPSGTAGSEAGSAPGSAAAPAKQRTFFTRARRLTGHFHPLLAHFPIALLVAAAVAELSWLRTRQSWLIGAVRFCTIFGALGAFVTAALGWVYYMDPKISADADLNWHRWLGTLAAVWALPVLFLSERGFRRRRDDPGAVGRPYLWFQVMLFAGVFLVGIAAHYGGLSVNGEDFLTF